MKLQPPSRLRDDPIVGADLRHDLAQVPRSAEMPIGYDLTAGLARLEASLRATTAVGTSEPGSTGASRAQIGSHVGTKAVVVAGLKGALVTGVAISVLAVGVATLGPRFIGQANSRAPERSLVAAPLVDTTANVAPVPPRPTSETAMTPRNGGPVEPAAQGSTGEPGQSSAVKPPSSRIGVFTTAPSRSTQRASVPGTTESANRAASAAPDERSAPVSSASDSLAQELDHLARLRALEASRPEEALRMAQEGDSLFPTGLFRQERQAIAIQSLVRLHRINDAKQRARAFKAAYPHSPFAERMKQLTNDDPE